MNNPVDTRSRNAHCQMARLSTPVIRLSCEHHSRPSRTGSPAQHLVAPVAQRDREIVCRLRQHPLGIDELELTVRSAAADGLQDVRGVGVAVDEHRRRGIERLAPRVRVVERLLHRRGAGTAGRGVPTA